MFATTKTAKPSGGYHPAINLGDRVFYLPSSEYKNENKACDVAYQTMMELIHKLEQMSWVEAKPAVQVWP